MSEIRIGKCSGKIFRDDDISKMSECGIVVTEDQLKDENFLQKNKVKNFVDCSSCRGCPCYNYEEEANNG